MSVKNKISRLLSLFGTALKGGEKEFTSGSINKAIFLLSIPMIAEMLMESLFAVVDVFFVARLGVEAVATVGLTESILMIIYSVAMGISMALTAIVSRRIGEKDPDRASAAAFQGIFLCLVFGSVTGLAGFYFAEDILRLMGADASLIASGSDYTKIIYAGNVSIILLFVINGIFRGAGDATIAMRSLWISNGLNIILDPMLIFGIGPFPEMGVAGAALATTIGRSTGVVYQLFYLFNGQSVILLTRDSFVLRWKTLMEILRIASGGAGQFLVESASWIFLVRIMSLFGAAALAGYTIAFRVIVFTILPSWGLANAAATLVGQNLGAKRPDRAEASVWRTARWNMFFLGGISLIFIVFAPQILSLFTDDLEALQVGKTGLQIICIGYVFFAYGMVISQSFNGAGDTRTPLLVNFGVFWLIQIPLSYLLAVSFDFQVEGVFFSIAFCHSIHALICIWLFRKGTWKTVEV